MSIAGAHTDSNFHRERSIDDLFLANIPPELSRFIQWVVYKLGPVKPTGKRDKFPLNPKTGALAKVDDPATWGTRGEAIDAYVSGMGDGLGFVFTAHDPYVGIDLDECRDPQTGQPEPWAMDIVQRIDSYTEASPSGTGVHILGKGKLPGGGKKKGHVEMYETGRFFTMTGEHISGTPTICEERQEPIDALYREHFSHTMNGNGAHTGTRTHAHMSEDERQLTLADLRLALPHIPAIEHDMWLQVGMGLHHVDSGKAGFDMWVEWSKTCPEKFDFADCAKRWRSFQDDGGITHKSIFGWAIEHGWRSQASSTGEDGTTAAGTFHLTDTGLAERFEHQHGTVTRWVEKWKKWLSFDTTRWQMDATHHVRKLAKETVRAMYQEAAAIEDDEQQRKKLAKFALQSESEKSRRAMLELAKSEGTISVLPTVFDTDPWLLNVANGTLDLRTGTLRKHSATDYITKCVPIIYDRTAVCPTWESFLATTFAGDAAVIDFIQKGTGYSLSGDVREDCLFLSYGEGANGKSTFLNTLEAVVGEYSQKVAFATLLHQDRDSIRNDLADLAGVRLATASEVDEGRRLSMSVMKALTGKDKIRARHLFSEHFEYAPQLKLWLAANHKPVITDTSHAAWRRIRLIPFTQKFEGATRDATMGDKLRAELPGILAWAVRGCRAWQKSGLPLPKAVKIATESYRAESDVIGTFLEECCEIDPKADVMTAFLYDTYVNWCKKSGEDKPKTKTGFGLLLQRRGFESGKNSSGLRVWKGIRVATSE